MNAAARALTQGLVIASNPTQLRKISLSKSMFMVLTLSIALICSALSIITLADKNRIAFGNLTALQQTQTSLDTMYNQLLLEENTWATPARVETIATQNFGMSQPDPKQVVIIQA